MKTDSSEWAHCNSCVRSTHHVAIHKYRNSEFQHEEKDYSGNVIASIEGFKDWAMLECQGCKTVCLKLDAYFSEDADPFDDGSSAVFFPERNVGARPKPAWFNEFVGLAALQGHFVLVSYNQIYELIESKKLLAALLTCRALLETLSVEHGHGDKGTFKEKLEALRAKELINAKQVTFLNQVIYDAGSAAMHRQFNPGERVVSGVLDAIEKLIHTIYLEPLVGAEISSQLPKNNRS